MDKEQRSQVWIARIEDFKASGMTMSAWCAANNLTIHQLKYWLRKTNHRSNSAPSTSSVNWLPLAALDSAAEGPQASPLLVRIGSISIEVRADFDAALLRQVVRALEVPC